MAEWFWFPDIVALKGVHVLLREGPHLAIGLVESLKLTVVRLYILAAPCPSHSGVHWHGPCAHHVVGTETAKASPQQAAPTRWRCKSLHERSPRLVVGHPKHSL